MPRHLLPEFAADAVLDAVLKASGSGLRHFTIHGTRERLRVALDTALRASLGAPPPDQLDAMDRVAFDAVNAGITLRGQLEADQIQPEQYVEAINDAAYQVASRLRALRLAPATVEG